MNPLTHLDFALTEGVRGLVERVQAADGVRPLNDEALLALDREGCRHWLVQTPDETVVAYAQHDPGFGTAQLTVDPRARRQGHGRRLLDAVRADGASGVWAFGDLEGARALAASDGLRAGRRLLILQRSLAEPIERRTVPRGVTIGSFADDDAEGLLAVNADAFAHHPEQGAFSRADLDARRAEGWWDPAGLLVARDAEGVVGFHWTKRHDETTGEVYVIGVASRAQGRGLGGVLLDAGLAHLRDSGCTRVILYVEDDNPALRLYERSGFTVAHSDALYHLS